MNEILGLVGNVAICGCFYLMARKEKKSKDKAWDRVIDLRVEIQELEEKNGELEKSCKIRKDTIEWKNKRIEGANKKIKELKKDILKLHEIQEFDNKVMKGRMEQIGDLQEDVRKASDCFSKDQITIADLNHELCEANYRVVELESEIEGMVKRGFVKLERARLLGRLSNGEKL